MESKVIILDANIAVKILHAEIGSEEAQSLLKACAIENVQVLVPEHFVYELVNVCHRLGIEVALALKLFETMKSSIMKVVTPEQSTWLLAEKIANNGHEKSGFPSMYDSIYHALAIETKGVFVTADKRHYTKAKHHSSMCLLHEWELVLRR